MKRLANWLKDAFLLACICLAWLAWAAVHSREIADECKALDDSERGMA